MPKNLPKDSHNDLDFLLISDFASFLHVSTHTVRNLEREFSIEVKKDVNGKRIYTFSDIEKYRKLLERKSNSLSNSVLNYKTSVLDNVPVKSVVDKKSEIPLKTNSSIKPTNLFHIFSYIYNFSKSFIVDNLQSMSRISRVSVALFLVVSISSYGSFILDKFLDISDVLSIYGKENYSSKNMSNVLQATNENWEYRFDVNIPAYFNNTLNGSNASFNLITVGNSVTISQEGVFAPNVINSINTVAGESLLLVDITDPNNPIISSQNNPAFDSLEVGSLLGVTEIDSTTISTLESSLNITGSTDAQTLQGLAAADFLRSNANTVFTNGIMTYDVSSSVKYNNINPNKFLRVDSSNNLIGFDILPGANVNFTSTANSITIDVNAITTSSQSSSIAVGTLFLGGTTFDINNLILATAQDLNKLYTLSGILISSANFNSTLFSNFINIDTDATNDIVLSNLSSSILSSFPKIDTDATNDVLLSSLASLMLSNYPNLDTNALDDVDVLQDAVLVTSGSAKNVYSINNWYGYQNFTEISGSVLEVEANGKLLLNPGAIPSDINNALYNYSDRLYFEELPLVQVGSHTQSDHANKFAIFTTDASNRLLLSGTPFIPLSALQTGSSLSILGMEGSNLRYLSVGGDLSVNTISSSTISFTLNNVNSNIGTFGNSLAVPTITVNAKGQITSISTSPFNVYYTSNISFSTPNSGSRVLTLQQPGLSNLSSSFTLLQSDIVSALGYTPLRNVTDSLTGDLGVSGNFSASSATFNSIALSNALSVNFGGTGITQTPANGQLIIGNAGGYTLSSLTAGTNVSITTGPGSIILSSFDTTNPNNFITSFSFTDSIPNRKILTINREGLSSISSSFSMSFDDIVSALGYTPQVNLGYTPLRNTTDTLTGSLGVSGNFSASSGSITNSFGIGGAFSAASAVISGNFSAGNSTLASALVLGNLTLSNPSGITALDFYANGASGDNIMMRSNFGNQVLAQINQDSTNALEIENFATGGLTNFNFPNNGQFNIYISDTPNNATNKLVLNQTFNDLNLFTNLNVGGTFSAGASRVSSLGVTNAFSAASGSVTGNFTIGGVLNVGTIAGDIFFTDNNTNLNFYSINNRVGSLNNSIINFVNVGGSTTIGRTMSIGHVVTSQNYIGFYTNSNLIARIQDDGNVIANGLTANDLIASDDFNLTRFHNGDQRKNINFINSASSDTYLGTTMSIGYIVSNLGEDNIRISSVRKISGVNQSLIDVAIFFGDGSVNIAGTLSAASGVFPSLLQTNDLRISSVAASPSITTTLCRTAGAGVQRVVLCSSNRAFKDSISDLTMGLEEIERLRPVEFNWKGDGKKDLGFIAEEVVEVNPILGEYGGENGELTGVRYMQLTSLLTKGIQEQQVQIQNLSNAVSSLNVSSLETLVESLNNTLDSLSMSTENGALVVNSGLTVTGEALFNNATFTGDVAIGQMKFDSLNNDISISGMPCTNIDGTLNESLCNTQTLFVMKNKAGNINFFDGKVLINPNGEMTLEKITVGEVAAAKVSASEYEVMAGSDISGNTKILTGQNEVTILTSKVKENSKIFITPTGNLEGSSLYVDSKLGGVSFTVKLSSPLSKEIEFDWFILNSE